MTSPFHTYVLLKRNERICSYKDLYMNVHNSFVCNSPKLETTQMAISRVKDKQMVLVCPYILVVVVVTVVTVVVVVVVVVYPFTQWIHYSATTNNY